jgi:ribonuclease HI
MSLWTCFTDGGCQGNPGPCAWGAVVIPPDGGARIEGSGFLGHGTNQIAELRAALHGIEMTPVGAEVLLVSDSQYALKGLTEWRRGWEAKGFRNSKGEIVANLAIWKLLYAAADQRRVRTQWVKGHSGHEHNERCDVLAAQAISQGTGAASRAAPAPASASASAPAAAPAPRMAAAAPQPATAPGTTWTPLSKPEPEGQTVLYGLLDTRGAVPQITRAETGLRTGAVRDKPWATHWMAIPAYLPR